MINEELERIKQAYSSGLKVQIWFNGHWEDFDIRDYSMFPEPFSEHRQYRIVGSAYADIAEKRIAELEKENAELKEKLGDVQMQKAGEKSDLVWKLKTANEQKAEQLTKAKVVIKNLVEFDGNSKDDEEYQYKCKLYNQIWEEAEKFLKESRP